MLLASIGIAWTLWILAGAADVAVHVAEGRRPAGSGFSVFPVIPLMPLLAWGLAAGLDVVAVPWGTRLVTAAHALLAVAHGRGAWVAVRRLRGGGAT